MRAFLSLFQPTGRSGRTSLALSLVLFFALGVVRNLVPEGPPTLVFLALQIAALWLILFSVPVRRFHDMGRGGWWAFVFLGGMVFAGAFVALDLQMIGDQIGAAPNLALRDPVDWGARVDAYNAASPAPANPAQRLTATGNGGISTIMILVLIYYGWLFAIRGDTAANRYGPPPSARRDT